MGVWALDFKEGRGGDTFSSHSRQSSIHPSVLKKISGCSCPCVSALRTHHAPVQVPCRDTLPICVRYKRWPGKGRRAHLGSKKDLGFGPLILGASCEWELLFAVSVSR